jgi:hypothetical protein|tara:strand:+ start:111 stop:335 length:225 start_codon:yes stop_codon:yes gene_type:complete
MSTEKEYNFVSKPYDKTMEQIDEVIESRGYKKAVKSFQNKYPKLKIVDVWWVKDGKEIYKEQKLPMGRKKKLEG